MPDDEPTILPFPGLDPQAAGVIERLDCPPQRKRPATKPYGNAVLRCRGGCGKKSVWPREGQPLFCTMLCGYRFAVRMLRGGK